MKLKWITPRLIVLTKGTVEENVLKSCKTHNPGGIPKGVCKERAGGPPAFFIGAS